MKKNILNFSKKISWKNDELMISFVKNKSFYINNIIFLKKAKTQKLCLMRWKKFCYIGET